MEEGLYCRLEWICSSLIERNVDRIYLYPFGNRGMQISEFLKCRYGFWKVIAVDENLSRYNPEIMDFESMRAEIHKGGGIVLLTSDNPMIYRELRLRVGKAVPKEKIWDCFQENPLVTAQDFRVAALAFASKQIYLNQIGGGHCGSRCISGRICTVHECIISGQKAVFV